MKILKFGGKSLSNGDGLNKVVAIITDKINQGEEIAIVVSARGNATDELEQILTLASENGNYKPLLKNLKPTSKMCMTVDLSEEFIILEKLFEA
jgi:aspartokinase/homoserine dehydrogenase 1